MLPQIKKVLLIDIPTYRVSLPKLHRKILEKKILAQSIISETRIGTKILRPSLSYSRGLLTIASCLERFGFNVKYINFSDPIDRNQIWTFVRECDVVGITSITPTFNKVISICKNLKKVNPKVIIILGGPHINALPIESLRQCQFADFAMIGNCDLRMSLFLNNISNPSDTPGVVFRNEIGNPEISSGKIPLVPISEVPPPAYHLLKRHLSYYAHNIRTYRSCPYKCNFCTERLSWESTEISEIEYYKIFEEIKFLSKYLYPGTLVHFSDSIFDINWNNTIELLELIKNAKLNLFFSFDTRVDLVSEEKMKIFSDAGFVSIRMGFESIHDNILQLSKKSITHKKQYDACKIIRKINPKILIHAYMLTGLPGTTKDSLIQDALNLPKLIDNNFVDIIGNKILVPYPGTPYFNFSEKTGIFIKTYDWSKYDRRSYPVYALKNLRSDEIYLGYLLQEATLTSSYLEKLRNNKINTSDLKKLVSNFDYIYVNYVQNID